MTTPKELVEILARASYAVACMEDRSYSQYDSVVYQAARLALRAAIVQTYPGMDVEKIIDMWIDCGESIAYCVDYINRQARELELENVRERMHDLIETTTTTYGPIDKTAILARRTTEFY